MSAAVLGSVLLAGCGGSAPAQPSYDTTPVTFSITTTTPTDMVPTPLAQPSLGPHQIPLETGPFLATPATTRLGTPVDGIQCQAFAQRAYTAYAHLQVYADGKSDALPGGIGLVGQDPNPTQNGWYWGGSTCMYWLHTRALDGVIEVQSPVPRRFTLGQFFKIWNQPLTQDRVADLHGPVTVTLNGKRWHGTPGSVPLREHAAIALSVGTPVPRQHPFDWLPSGL